MKKKTILFFVTTIVVFCFIWNCREKPETKEIFPKTCDVSLFLTDTIQYTRASCRAFEKKRGALEVKLPYNESYFSYIFGDGKFGGPHLEEHLENYLFFLNENKETGLHEFSTYKFGVPSFSGCIDYDAMTFRPDVFSSVIRKYFYYDPYIEELFGVKMRDSINFKSYKEIILCTKKELELKNKESIKYKKDTQTLKGKKGDIPHQDFLQYTIYQPRDSINNFKAITESFLVDYTVSKKQFNHYARIENQEFQRNYFGASLDEKQIAVYYSFIINNRCEYYIHHLSKNDSLINAYNMKQQEIEEYRKLINKQN